MKRRLQVFVSSTFTDLREERQAAVEAILRAGDIPAGMELFTAGDESQMQVIRRWIDESDVYLLILGGRYGSIDPKSGRSYIDLEYEHAGTQGIPRFVVAMRDDLLETIRATNPRDQRLEQNEPAKYEAFRKSILGSKISSFYTDSKDVKLAIHETLGEWKLTRNFKGWISGVEVSEIKPLIDEMAALRTENARLQADIAKIEKQVKKQVNAEEIVSTLNQMKVQIPSKLTGGKGATDIDLATLVSHFGDELVVGVINSYGMGDSRKFLFFEVLPKLAAHGLAEKERIAGKPYQRFQLNDAGREVLRFMQLRQIERERVRSQAQKVAEGKSPPTQPSTKPREPSETRSSGGANTEATRRTSSRPKEKKK